MIITDKFVVLNMPKTGTSFVRECLKKVYEVSSLKARIRRKIFPRSVRFEELILPKVYAEYEPYKKMVDQHGTAVQIPKQHKKKEILSITRDPFEKIISVYEYGFWKNYPVYDVNKIKMAFPSYPDLSFEEFVDFYHEFWVKFLIGERNLSVDIGPQTLLYIKFYSNQPDKIIDQLSDEFNLNNSNLFEDITFLHTEELNSELYDFLLKKGHSEKKIEFIRSYPKKNRSHKSRSNYFNNRMKKKILYKERFLFNRFPEYLA